MKYLYHYCSFNRLENIVANDTLYFQSPSDVNDPFDCQIHPLLGKNEDRETLRLAWDMYRKRIGLFCLSEVDNDILMWSHYGDKHRGVVLRFDSDILLKHFEGMESFKIFKSVTYHKDWPNITDFNMVFNSAANSGFGNRTRDLETLEAMVFLRKSLHWCYESEWRIVLEENGFMPIYPGALSGIILGCKMVDADYAKVENYRKKYKKENLEVIRLKECFASYCLEIDQRYINEERKY